MFDSVMDGGRGEDLLRSLQVKVERNQMGNLILSGQRLALRDSVCDVYEDFFVMANLYDSFRLISVTHFWGIRKSEIMGSELVSDGDLWGLKPTISFLGSKDSFSRFHISIWSGWGRRRYSSLVVDRVGSLLLDLGFYKERLVFVKVNTLILSDLLCKGILILVKDLIPFEQIWLSSGVLILIWLVIEFEIFFSWTSWWIRLFLLLVSIQNYSMLRFLHRLVSALIFRLGMIEFGLRISLIRFVLIPGILVGAVVFKREFEDSFRIISFCFCFSFLLVFVTFLSAQYFFPYRVMAQLALNKNKSSLVRTDTVSISNSVLAKRIQQFSLTLIGRLMNPVCQNMESLLANFPKIWKLEEKVVGADLGQGVFQFNFEEEEDILSVLQNGPYHFNGWMVSLVRWELVISSSYPSAINFWVKVAGIPMHLWEVANLEAIGKKLGRIQEVDEETGSLCVPVNGFNPLILKMVVPFATGDEIIVSLEYEKLNGVCDLCSRITHDTKVCPKVLKETSAPSAGGQRDNRGGQRQFPAMKQEQHHNVGGWEKPRKHAKRALDFQSVDSSEIGYFPQQRFGGNVFHGQGSHGSRHQERSYGQVWGQKRSYKEVVGREEGSRRGTQTGNGEVSGKAPGFILNRKGAGPAWPKPLFKV
ncbi:PREDICTED: uncharacterized protein LOC104757886 [Camelina sativa]|uniref:Uncharacterized protein LOC104757886 n=1 Tax=Camelina sativa TaxID=90675 RepID=A0ABM0X0U7_CAMSA|nr:PREDICTED: uncharacterized protein LOC104757886 [Camelina sativa]